MSGSAPTISIGHGLQSSACARLQLTDRDHESLAATLASAPRGPDSWAIPGTFSDDTRTIATWEGADGALLDFDFRDTTKTGNAGHRPVPDDVRDAVTRVARAHFPAGVFYCTARGFRFGVIFAAPVRSADAFSRAVRALATAILTILSEEGLPTTQDSDIGFEFDHNSLKVNQIQRLPLPEFEAIVTGNTPWEARELADGAALLRLNLANALPQSLTQAAAMVARIAMIAPEVPAVHLLATASALIGNTTHVVLRGRIQNLSLQFLTLAESGAGKSTVRALFEPALHRILKEIRERRIKAENDIEAYNAQIEEWKKSKKVRRDTPRPVKPNAKLRETLILTEATLEAVYDDLMDSQRGMLWTTSEAHEFLGSLGGYASQRSGRDRDAARFRKLADGETCDIHRTSGHARFVYKPFLAVDLDAQPLLWKSLFTAADLVSGLSARFLMHQPVSLVGWRDYLAKAPHLWVDPVESLKPLFENLWAIPLGLDDEGFPRPRVLSVHPAAERAWAEEIQRNEIRMRNAPPEERAALGHIRGRLVRLAAVLAICEDPTAISVDLVAMNRAITWGRYFMRHFRYLAAELRHQSEQDEVASVRRWAERQERAGGEISFGTLSKNFDRYQGRKGARLADRHLHDAGLDPMLGQPKTGPGRPAGVRWRFPNRPEKPEKCPQGDFTGFTGEVGDFDRRFDAFNRWLDPQIDLPPGGKGQCPICGHNHGCFGRIKDTYRWKCFADGHAQATGGAADSGDLVDLYLFQMIGRLPTPRERVDALIAFEGGNPKGGAS